MLAFSWDQNAGQIQRYVWYESQLTSHDTGTAGLKDYSSDDICVHLQIEACKYCSVVRCFWR